MRRLVEAILASRKKTLTAVFVLSAILLSLFSWDRVLSPSRHFHFLDLANSFLNGRLDTDTPNRLRGEAERPDDAPGLRDAVRRHTAEGAKTVGWNDWAALRVITLTDGTEVKGAFPWNDQPGDAKKRFRTVDGQELVIDADLDVARTCGPNGTSRCDQTLNFVSFPPFPAIAMMPGFLIFGYDFNDTLFTVLDAALNALLLLLLLELLVSRGLSQRSRRENVMLALLFTFGTVSLFSSIRGEVWFSALILGITMNILFMLFALEARHPFLAGLMLGLGMATRTPLAFAVVFFALELLRDGDRMRWPGWAPLLKKGALFALPVLAVGIALMAYNLARFDNAFEFGHTYLANGTRPSIREHGLFSPWFLKNNLAAFLSNPLVIDGTKPFVHVTLHGLSLFVCTPALLWLLWPRRWSKLATNLAIAAACLAIPNLFYQNTGWRQFGYRFALDFMPYLFALLAVGSARFSRLFYVAVVLSLLVNAFGAVTFDRMGQFYYD